MKRRVLVLLFALTMLFNLLPQAALTARAETWSGTCGAESDGSNLTWIFDETTGLLTIEGSGAMADYDIFEDDSAPWTPYYMEISAVILPEGLTRIGDYAFYWCCSLTSAELPNTVVSIGDHAFSACHGLKSVAIPDNVTSIGKAAFSYCECLTSILIPDSVTSIEDETFQYCDVLESVTIGNHVTGIGNEAFEDCRALTSITIPAAGHHGDRRRWPAPRR